MKIALCYRGAYDLPYNVSKDTKLNGDPVTVKNVSQQYINNILPNHRAAIFSSDYDFDIFVTTYSAGEVEDHVLQSELQNVGTLKHVEFITYNNTVQGLLVNKSLQSIEKIVDDYDLIINMRFDVHLLKELEWIISRTIENTINFLWREYSWKECMEQNRSITSEYFIERICDFCIIYQPPQHHALQSCIQPTDWHFHRLGIRLLETGFIPGPGGLHFITDGFYQSGHGSKELAILDYMYPDFHLNKYALLDPPPGWVPNQQTDPFPPEWQYSYHKYT